MELLIVLAFAGLPLLVGLFIGRVLQNQHYESIRRREKHWQDIPTVTFYKSYPHPSPIEKSELASGSIVVSMNHFQRFLASWRKFFGGEIKSFASVIDRGRREALLRMRESSPDADAFINCRLETSTISKGKNDKSVGCAEVFAYGTAVYYKQ